ncbi:MFS transporter [Chelatococcus reniformis]|uniref:MFS transporter n=1 Tax=Chelatococcus reniformis TaxID=1494448 RepID=A0A916TWR3_9HYPH|nr:MFS transporter [Chelatococcus reniformis]
MTPPAPTRIAVGTAAFRHANAALFAAGFASFAILYCVQPLLPVFAADFGVSAAESSLALSVSTAALAVSLLVASSLSEALGRKPLMVASLAASAALTLLSAAAPDWTSLLILRVLTGLALGGVPAVAMAYAGEEMHARGMPLSMGLIVGGNALGGMTGRLVAGTIADFAPWQAAMAAIAGIAVVATLLFWRSLPASRHFVRQPLELTGLVRSLLMHRRDLGLVLLFAEAFLLMGSFVTIYNYAAFRLLAPPFELSQALASTISVIYLTGIVSSTWAGALAGRLGRRHLLWIGIAIMLAGLLLTLADDLALFVFGVIATTCGFFAAHSVASGWVGYRARSAKAQAAALYLFLYYLGSSIVGTSGGLFYAHAGWTGVVAFTSTLTFVALLIALRLTRIAPLPP